MRIYATSSIDYLDPTTWFDLWHCHIDWEGRGDKHEENRQSSLALGYETFTQIENFKQKVDGPIQSWWFIHEKSYEDAVYLHSPNPNGTPFPHEFENVQWGEPNNELLLKLVNLRQYKIGTMVNEHGTTYVVTENA